MLGVGNRGEKEVSGGLEVECGWNVWCKLVSHFEYWFFL